jgi:hypothetical protein
MSEINWGLLQPVDIGAQVQQGFATGAALVKHGQTQHALKAYLANPDDPKAFSALAYYDPATAHDMQTNRILQQKMQRETADRGRAVALGQLATKDPAGARQEALAAGDFDLAKTFGELDDESRKRAAAFWTDAAPLAFKLRQIPDPEQRKALFAQARPILQAHGADSAQLDSFDPTNDTALDAVIATGQKVSELIDQGRVTWHQQGEQPSFATDFTGRPVGSQNPYAQGHAPAAASPAAAGGFDASVEHVLGNEGGYSTSDMNGKPVNFGINQGANPDIDVKNLTRDQAKQIYHDRYWVPSGAEQLPPNLQAPYFDVYIRNPKVAQQALQSSGGDPAKFMEITNGYFRHLGQTPEGQKYAHAWANRDSKNLSIATGAPHITSKTDFDALPSGAEFIAPDGTHRRKP